MKRFLCISLAAMMVLAVSCKKEPRIPSVKTLEATEIEANSARLNAKTDLDGVKYASAYFGFYLGTSKDPEGTYITGKDIDGKGDYSAVITGLTPEKQYWYKAFVEIDGNPYSGEILNFTTLPKGAVDLGIEMTRGDGTTYKLYWAKSNLCKSGLCAKPEDYGDYYAWAETSPKSDYYWSTYKFGEGPFSKYNTKSSYGTVDNKTVLDPEDDAAHVKLGGKWRMPTDAEWTALREQCDWKWISDYNGTGVSGSTITASNGNSIFLPAAGRWGAAGLDFAGSYGLYWSSTLLMSDPFGAWYAYFNSESFIRLYFTRYHGFSVRPVYED